MPYFLSVVVMAATLFRADSADAQARTRGDSATKWTSRFSGDTVWTESATASVRYVERGDTIWVTVRRAQEPERTVRWLVTGEVATATGPRGAIKQSASQLRSFRKAALLMERMEGSLQHLPTRKTDRP